MHAHAIKTGPALVEDAQRLLVTAGERWTDLRATAFEVLAGCAKPASAYEIADIICGQLHRRVPVNSVYRILDLFVQHNLAMRVESRNAYVVNPHPGCRHDCIFLLCEHCGRSVHFDDDAIAEALRSAAVLGGFRPEWAILEVVGRCGACDEARAGEAADVPEPTPRDALR